MCLVYLLHNLFPSITSYDTMPAHTRFTIYVTSVTKRLIAVPMSVSKTPKTEISLPKKLKRQGRTSLTSFAPSGKDFSEHAPLKERLAGHYPERSVFQKGGAV